MHISPDDPGIFHYGDVSYDYLAVAVAWNLGLEHLHLLARNSLAYSTLRGEGLTRALNCFDDSWEGWLKAESELLSGSDGRKFAGDAP